MKVLLALRMELAFLILLLGVGFHFSGILYSDTILIKKTPYFGTPGLFDVILGKGKLERMAGTPPAVTNLSLDRVFVPELSKPSSQRDEKLYAITCSPRGVGVSHLGDDLAHLAVDMRGLSAFSPFTIYSYFGVVLFTLGRLVYCWRKVRKKDVAESELIDESSHSKDR